MAATRRPPREPPGRGTPWDARTGGWRRTAAPTTITPQPRTAVVKPTPQVGQPVVIAGRVSDERFVLRAKCDAGLVCI